MSEDEIKNQLLLDIGRIKDFINDDTTSSILSAIKLARTVSGIHRDMIKKSLNKYSSRI
jgi:hypothetical protein